MIGKRPILKATFVALLVLLVSCGYYTYRNWARTLQYASLFYNAALSFTAPAGTLVLERATPDDGQLQAPSSGAAVPVDGTQPKDWPSYNRTLTSERFSPIAQIDRSNVDRLKVLCTYDTGQYSSFEPGLIMVGGRLVGTSGTDIFAIDPDDCREIWRTHEPDPASTFLVVNRGAAYLDGRLFRGMQDGRVIAYDFKTGARLWETMIADPQRGESVPAAPVAWNGLVFIGNAGGDAKGVKGRMYALDATTGRIVWEFYLLPKGPDDVPRGSQGASPLDASSWQNTPGTPISGGATWTSYTLDPANGLLYVPGGNPAPDFATGPREGENLYSGSMVVLDAMTGAYRQHFKLVPRDWHDWDVSNPPTLVATRAGRRIMATAPKDGYLYGFDLPTSTMLYRTPVTRMENADATFSVGKSVHFCPGTLGGAEWNGPAYDPSTNLLLIGEVDWCTTVTLASEETIAKVPTGYVWSGMDTSNPFYLFGKPDPFGIWAGWITAVDADTGKWIWRLKSNYPVLSGMTPTAGGVSFFGDMGGNFYAVDSATGTPLWHRAFTGAIGGGVISYIAGGSQKIAAAIGFTAVLWPTKWATGKVVVMGLE